MSDNWKQRVYDSYMSNGFTESHNRPKEFEIQYKYFKLNYLKYMPLDKNCKILDLGCGMGQFLDFCIKQGYKNCEGVDISRENVNYLKKMFGSKVSVFEASAVDYLENKHDDYDAIVFNDVIEHLSKKEIFETLDIIKRALKPGGVCFIKTPNMANPYVSTVGRYIDITHEVGFTEISMRQVLRAIGFVRIEVIGTDIYVLNPIISILAKCISAINNVVLYFFAALYGRTTIKIYEKDILAVAYKNEK